MITRNQNRCGKVMLFVGMRRAVRDIDRAIDFYTGALGFKLNDKAVHTVDSRDAHLTLGSESIDLYSPEHWCESINDEDVNATINNSAFQHIAIVTQDMSESLKRLRRFDPKFISHDGAVHLPPGAGGVTACKFLDPDGHPLELITFPAGVGDPKWQNTIEYGPNLGIDHSAMSVVDVDASISFYVRGLGFKMNSRHFNKGVEQAHLDGVSESVVDVVTLFPGIQSTPHFELLSYREPVAHSRNIPTSLDQDHADQLILMVDDIAAVFANLRDIYQSYELADPPIAADGDSIRDADGHILRLIVERPN